MIRFVNEIDSEIKPANEVEIVDTSANEVGDKPAYVQHLGKLYGKHIRCLWKENIFDFLTWGSLEY